MFLMNNNRVRFRRNLSIIIFFSFSVIFYSCDPSTGISVKNNTGHPIQIECETIYDTQTVGVSAYAGRLSRSIKRPSPYGGDFHILGAPYILRENEEISIIFCIGTDILSEIRFGTIKSNDDVISAIDKIFTNISVYIFNDDGEKKLLYDKNYFLNKQNFNFNHKNFEYFITININYDK
jgi:hypothetical protein